MESSEFTPMILTKRLKSKKQVLDCEVKVSSLANPEVTVYVKLYFWCRLRAVLYSDYANRLISDWGLEIIENLPEGTSLNLKLVL